MLRQTIHHLTKENLKRRLSYACLFFFLMTMAPAAWAMLTDPTRPSDYKGPVLTAPNQHTIKVSSILVTPYHRNAVINGSMRHEGDMVKGAKIIKINHHNVVFKNGTGQFSIDVIEKGPYISVKPSKGK